MEKYKFSAKEVIFLVVITCLLSVFAGYFLRKTNEPVLSTKRDVEYNEDIAKFVENYNSIKDNYYKEVDPNDLIDAAISGMVNSLEDVHSSSVPEESSKVFNAQLDGLYKGIGVEIFNDDNMNIIVAGVFDGSPAKIAGIKAGDTIIKAGGREFKNSKTSDLTDYISSISEDTFSVTVLRDGSELEFEVSKDIVVLKSVASEIIEVEDTKIGYIYISIFAGNTASQFAAALDDVSGADSIIIDVRNNSGGHLVAVKDMLSLMLDSTHIIYKEEKKGVVSEFYSTGTMDYDKEIVLIQNELSASASEILVSGLSEQLGAKIVGMPSFGKGTVQELITVDSNLQYKYTTKKWLTSLGDWIDGDGITPDFKLQLDQNYIDNPSRENDNQLDKALELLTNNN